MMKINDTILADWLEQQHPTATKKEIDNMVNGIVWKNPTDNVPTHEDDNGTMVFCNSNCSFYLRHDSEWTIIESSLNEANPDPRIQTHLI